MAGNKATAYADTSYIQGSAAPSRVRVLEDPRKDPFYRAKLQEERARRRMMAQVERMSRVYVMFLIVAAVMLVGICYQFLNMRTTMNKNVAEISSLRVELEDLKAENDFQLSRINESVDLNEIREAAVGRLGMVEADGSRVVQYTYGENDYLRQYVAVPKEDGAAASGRKN